MIRARLSVERLTPHPDGAGWADKPTVVTVEGGIDQRYVSVLELVQRANRNDGKIYVVSYRDVKMSSSGAEEETVRAEVWGGSFLVFEEAARKLGAEPGHPFLVLCQAARELGAAGSRPLHFSVEVA